ncbi:MAG: alpha/beta hydrolase [Candidatus Thermoplasmatota archaeon]|nr:alpha/beta hydrolase [Candidatus Thermoplasmatota archaeon]
MKNLRKYGNKPFNVAVIHGGPGAPGEMAPIARELSINNGILEPFQMETTIEGQVKELKTLLERRGKAPFILVGWSWGAWLSYIFSAKYPSLIKKLIMIGSGPFEKEYAKNIMRTRLNRLNSTEKTQVNLLFDILNDPSSNNKNTHLERFGNLIFKADSYEAIHYKNEIIEYQYDIYYKIWKQAIELRNSGKLLNFGKEIICPVVAIHGDYDPHPFKGVQEPLYQMIKDFKFILLKRCGHYPWIEKHARDRFFDILKKEVK